MGVQIPDAAQSWLVSFWLESEDLGFDIHISFLGNLKSTPLAGLNDRGRRSFHVRAVAYKLFDRSSGQGLYLVELA